jgi:hypothetical protein
VSERLRKRKDKRRAKRDRGYRKQRRERDSECQQPLESLMRKTPIAKFLFSILSRA